MNKRRIVVGALIAVLVLAAIAAGAMLLFSPSSSSAHPSASASTGTSRVLIANQDIPAGTSGSKVASLVSTVSVPAAQLSSGAITDPTQIPTVNTTMIVKSGSQLTLSAFGAGEGTASSVASATAMPSGTVALYLSMSGVEATNGNLHAGQRISIFVTMSKGSSQTITTQRAFSHVPVLSVSAQTSVGSGVSTVAPTTSQQPAASAAPSATASSTQSVIKTTVQPVVQSSTNVVMALALNPDDGARLITAFKTGQLWLAVEDDNSPGGYGNAVKADGVFQ